MDVRFHFMSTDDLFELLQREFVTFVLLHHVKDQWCLHCEVQSDGFKGVTPRECALKALAKFIQIREASRLN